MNKCQICGKEFEKRISLERHIGTSFGKEKKKQHCPLLAYFAKYEDRTEFSKRSLKKMYVKELKSTLIMADELRVPKATLLRTMHYYKILLRNLSEATRNQICRDGLWNKGKTRFNHPSIKKYADTRRGKNNPYFTAPGFEERHAKNLERFRLLHIKNDGTGNRDPKTTERRMRKILDAHGLQYVRNFCLKNATTWRLYDFLIEGTLIVEMQGNYYHANPRMYKPDDTIAIRYTGRSVKDIWKYDAEKEKLARQHRYNFLAIWEDDFISMTDCEVMDLVVLSCRKVAQEGGLGVL